VLLSYAWLAEHTGWQLSQALLEPPRQDDPTLLHNLPDKACQSALSSTVVVTMVNQG